MINIQQAVKDAIDEFVDRAHERFEYADVGWSNCTSNDYLAPECFILRLKPLPELFEHDVSFYGADAYLMWELNNELDFIVSNLSVLCAIDQGVDVRRKTSSAQKFDIERAKAGDVVEMLMAHTEQWERVPTCDLVYTHGQEHRMRMKYPKGGKMTIRFLLVCIVSITLSFGIS